MEFWGHGNGGIIGHLWGSSLDGRLSYEPNFVMKAADLTTGTHTIYYVVVDDNSRFSEPCTAKLTIQARVGHEIFVDATTGNDSNDGSEDAPLKTITKALDMIEVSEENPGTVHVAEGTYSPSTNSERFPLEMTSWVSLVGYDSLTTCLDAEFTAGPLISCVGVHDLTISGLTIRRGEGIKGGGIYCDQSSPRIEHNTIEDCRAYWGAAMYCENGSANIFDNLIQHNSADQLGGAIYSRDSSPTICNNVVVKNLAADGGGAIRCLDSSGLIGNNTIANNSAGGQGGAIYCRMYYTDLTPTIIDCILWGNGDDLRDCSASYCCIEDLDAGEGNVHDDPMFVSGPLGEYYLHPDSPCIDAGSRTAQGAGLTDRTTQTDGTPDTGIVDMGYHYPVLTQTLVDQPCTE